jgi:hypothetical protein
MKSDVPSNAPPPPHRGAASLSSAEAPLLSNVRDRSLSELEADLEATLRHGKSSLVLSPAQDGTPAISSLISVWLLSQVGKAIGTAKPVNLSTVTNRDELRSVGGVARLLHGVLHPVSAIVS